LYQIHAKDLTATGCTLYYYDGKLAMQMADQKYWENILSQLIAAKGKALPLLNYLSTTP
jgi:hypothetical protein